MVVVCCCVLLCVVVVVLTVKLMTGLWRYVITNAPNYGGRVPVDTTPGPAPVHTALKNRPRCRRAAPFLLRPGLQQCRWPLSPCGPAIIRRELTRRVLPWCWCQSSVPVGRRSRCPPWSANGGSPLPAPQPPRAQTPLPSPPRGSRCASSKLMHRRVIRHIPTQHPKTTPDNVKTRIRTNRAIKETQNSTRVSQTKTTGQRSLIKGSPELPQTRNRDKRGLSTMKRTGQMHRTKNTKPTNKIQKKYSNSTNTGNSSSRAKE